MRAHYHYSPPAALCCRATAHLSPPAPLTATHPPPTAHRPTPTAQRPTRQKVMAIFCLATSLDDLKHRLGNIVVGYTCERVAVTARDLKADGAMAVLLKDAMQPNLVQTLEKTPAFVHGGPFANIAHGCNSVIATKTALRLADYVVT